MKSWRPVLMHDLIFGMGVILALGVLAGLLLVHLDPGFDGDPWYERDWGWTPGLRHAVVVFGRAGDDRIDVGDPSIGREEWTLADLRVLWHGEVVRLEPRESDVQRLVALRRVGSAAQTRCWNCVATWLNLACNERVRRLLSADDLH